MYIDIKVGVAVVFTPNPRSVKPTSSLNAFVLRHGAERVLSVTIELEQEVVVLPEGFTMGDCDERDALLLHVGVEMALNVDRDGAGALVKDSVEGLVVD